MLGAALAAAAGLAMWGADRGPDSLLRPADAPGWARFRDYLLEGPDAGAWASNAAALWLGRPEDLDPHRLPILPRLIALALEVVPSPALAGHLVNHLLLLALGPVVYLLGSRWMGRGLAFGAALATVWYPPAVMAAERYGVDPLVLVVLPVALLAGEAAALRWWLAPLFGVIVGLAAAAHLTTIGIGVPALLLTLFHGAPGFRRWLGALGLVAGTFLGVGLAFHDYPVLPWGLLTGSLAEGVAPMEPSGDSGTLAESMGRAIAIVQAGGPAALDLGIGFLAASTRPSWLPWAAVLWLPWLGILGWNRSRTAHEPARPGRLTRVWYGKLAPLRGLGAGVPLAIALVPILAFAAAGSPPRYSQNYFPLGVLLVFRGLAVVVGLVEQGLARWLPARARGGLGVVVGLAAAVGLWQGDRAFGQLRLPPSPLDVADWQLGAVLAAHFPPGGGASCLRREVVAYAARTYCPHTPGFDFSRADEPVRAHLDAECGGVGPIPYVILSGVADGATEGRRRMDAWVEANATLVETVEGADYDARVYAVDRPAP